LAKIKESFGTSIIQLTFRIWT